MRSENIQAALEGRRPFLEGYKDAQTIGASKQTKPCRAGGSGGALRAAGGVGEDEGERLNAVVIVHPPPKSC